MTLGIRMFTLATVMTMTVLVFSIRSRFSEVDDGAELAAVQARLDALPLSFGDGQFRAERLEVEPEVLELSGAQAYAQMVVRRAGDESHPLQLYVGAAVQPDVFFHPPYWCLPSAGYHVSEQGPASLDIAGRGRTSVNRMVATQGRRKMLIYFWYQASGEAGHEWWATRYFRFEDLIARRPFRPTFIVVLYATVTTSVPETEALAQQFLGAVHPDLQQALAPTGKSQ